MTSHKPRLCELRKCQHYGGIIGPPEMALHVCKAFPEAIPEAILSGRNMHLTPVEGDEGIVYKPPKGGDPIIKAETINNTEAVIQAFQILRGGPTSGNWGHKGRPGKHGGSVSGGGHKALGLKGKPSNRKQVKAAAQKLGNERQAQRKQAKAEAKAVRALTDKKRSLEDLSRDELLTLRSRIDTLLGDSKEENQKLAIEKPDPKSGKGHVVTVPGADPKNKYQMQYEVRELDDLVTSNTDSGAVNPDFPKELQPRDRTRLASRQQVDTIARQLEPDAVLGEFNAIDRGTPIIGDDNVVESGNGRTMALRRARDQYPESHANYQAALRKQAADKGIDPETLDQFENPVLVRRRIDNVDRAKFAQEANMAQILGTSDIERARVDAGRIRSESLQNISARDTIDDTLRAPQNRDFVRSFVANTPENERASMMDSQGNLTRTGENRIKAAMFNRVYDDNQLAGRIFESTDNDIKNVTNGVMNSLGPMSRAEELVRTGQRASDLSIAPDISAAVSKYAALKQSGTSVENFLGQGALFGRDLSPVQERILVEIDNRRRSGKKMKEFLDLWPELVQAQPHPQQGGLFGGPTGLSKSELVDAWITRANTQPQISMFKADLLWLAESIVMVTRGGPTSGNWLHDGRPGKHGGSQPGGGHKRLYPKGVPPKASRKNLLFVREIKKRQKDAQREREGKAAAHQKKRAEKGRAHPEIKKPPRFKNNKEAEEWATEHLISDKAKASHERDLKKVAELRKQGYNIRDPKPLVSFRGLKPDASQEIADTVAEMLNDSDMPPLSGIETKPLRKQRWAASMGSNGQLQVNSVMAKDKKGVIELTKKSKENYSPEAKKLYQDLLNDPEAMARATTQQRRMLTSKATSEHFKYDRFTVSRDDNPYKSLIEHEMGHHIDFQAEGRIPNWRDRSKSAIQSMMTDEFKYKLSEYAGSLETMISGATREEVFAESVTAYRKGERSGTLSKEMISLLDEVFSG